MSYDGNGNFIRLYSWQNDAAANIKIRADRFDNELNGMATGLSTCITKDGQTTPTGSLPMAGYVHLNVGAGTLRTQYTRLDQTQDGKVNWVDGGGTADAITAAYSPAITTLVDGQECYVRATAANATTTPTFSPNALTARTIVKNGNVALAAGDIAGDGHELHLRYRLSDTKWELLNPAVTGVAILAANNTFSGTNTFTGKIVYPDDGELTIVSGVITVTGVYHTVDTEGDAATDDLVTINGGADGQILILRTENDARDVVLKSTGNIDLVADVTLSSTDSPVELIYDGALSKWLQRSATAAQGSKADLALPSASYNVTPWVAYTPVFTGFGTVSSVSFFSRRFGDTLEVRGKFTSGTSTAVEARVSLGFNGVEGTLTINAAKVPSGVNYAGSGVRSNTTANHYYMIGQGGDGYLNFGLQTGGIAAANGSGIITSGESFIFNASVPITGWVA